MTAPVSARPLAAEPINERRRRLRMRNIAIGVVLGALVVLFYAVTLVKLMGGST
ncbi:MAG: hypothetical protein U1E56_10395 [Bauldia sp.]